jgi:hypothetical protein
VVGSAANPMMQELGLTSEQFGLVLFAHGQCMAHTLDRRRVILSHGATSPRLEATLQGASIT